MRGNSQLSWARYRCTVFGLSKIARLGGVRDTYELKSNAAGFNAADRNVEEAAGALYTWSVSITVCFQLSSRCNLELCEVEVLLTGVGHDCAIEDYVEGG
jgi:hypothetical protein